MQDSFGTDGDADTEAERNAENTDDAETEAKNGDEKSEQDPYNSRRIRKSLSLASHVRLIV